MLYNFNYSWPLNKAGVRVADLLCNQKSEYNLQLVLHIYDSSPWLCSSMSMDPPNSRSCSGVVFTIEKNMVIWQPMKFKICRWKKQETSRKISASLTTLKPLTVDHNKLWKILKEMGIPGHLTCLLRNPYAGQEITIRTRHGTMDWFQIGKGVY